MVRRRSAQPGGVAAPRAGPARDRRGRGARGPLLLAGPLSPSPPLGQDRAQEFDDLVVALVERLAGRFEDELRDVEFGTEDVPQIPEDWTDEPVPLGSLVRATSGKPPRIVLFRRPIELRTRTRVERVALVHEVLVEHMADLLGRDADEIDP